MRGLDSRDEEVIHLIFASVDDSLRKTVSSRLLQWTRKGVFLYYEVEFLVLFLEGFSSWRISL